MTILSLSLEHKSQYALVGPVVLYQYKQCKCEFTYYDIIISKKMTAVRLLKNFSILYAYSFVRLLQTVLLLEML